MILFIVHGNRTSLKKKFNRKMKRVVDCTIHELVDQNQENQNEQ